MNDTTWIIAHIVCISALFGFTVATLFAFDNRATAVAAFSLLVNSTLLLLLLSLDSPSGLAPAENRRSSKKTAIIAGSCINFILMLASFALAARVSRQVGDHVSLAILCGSAIIAGCSILTTIGMDLYLLCQFWSDEKDMFGVHHDLRPEAWERSSLFAA